MVSGGILGSERAAVQLVSSDVRTHVYVPTEGVVPMLPREQVRVAVASWRQ